MGPAWRGQALSYGTFATFARLSSYQWRWLDRAGDRKQSRLAQAVAFVPTMGPKYSSIPRAGQGPIRALPVVDLLARVGGTLSSTILVMPCFNEARRLSKQTLLAFAERWTEGHLLLVDDGSTDGTDAILMDLARARPASFSTERLAQNSGKAEAVRQGVLAALQRAPGLVGYWDADLATPLEAVGDFEQVLRARPEVDIVIGSRVRLMGRAIERRPARHYLGRLFATAASVVLSTAVYDTQCGAKLFRANERVARLFQAPFGSRWIFDVELLARYLDGPPADGLDPRERIFELPLKAWRDVEGSKVKGADFGRAALDLARIGFGRTRR